MGSRLFQRKILGGKGERGLLLLSLCIVTNVYMDLAKNPKKSRAVFFGFFILVTFILVLLFLFESSSLKCRNSQDGGVWHP